MGTADGHRAASGTGPARLRRWGRPGSARAVTAAMALAVLAIVLAACGGGPVGTGQKMPSISTGSEANTSEPKELAPNFTFTLFQGEEKLGGKQLDLSQLRGTPLVLNFWAGLCPPCRAEMPDLQSFYDEFKDRINLLGIDVGRFIGLGSLEDARELLEELHITYPAGFTDDASLVRKYQVLGMPTTVFIAANGEILSKWTGGLNRDVLLKQTKAMLGR